MTIQLHPPSYTETFFGPAEPFFRPDLYSGTAAALILDQIHVKTDLDGNPLDFHLTGGEVSDTTQFRDVP